MFWDIRYSLTVLIMLATGSAIASDPTVEQSVPSRVLLDKRRNIATLVIENDSIGSGTDNNYTSGVRFNYTDVGSQSPRLALILDKLLPAFEINKTTAIYYSFGQSLYTPRDITRSEADPDDRPWAAFLYGSMGMSTLTDNHLDEVEFTAGVIGPAALGEQSQKFIHKYLTGSPTPQGWDHQLKNEPGVMLAWQRSLPMYIHGDVGKSFWSFKPYAGLTAGNVETYGDVGFTLRLSPADSKWQDTPLRVRPAMQGTGIYELPKNKWSWALFSGIEGRAVVRDIFLDGNTFTQSYNVNKKPIVMDTTAGAALTYQNYRISYSMVYRTKEFIGHDKPQIFGALSASVRF